jgi:hypothetical protein
LLITKLFCGAENIKWDSDKLSNLSLVNHEIILWSRKHEGNPDQLRNLSLVNHIIILQADNTEEILLSLGLNLKLYQVGLGCPQGFRLKRKDAKKLQI